MVESSEMQKSNTGGASSNMLGRKSSEPPKSGNKFWGGVSRFQEDLGKQREEQEKFIQSHNQPQMETPEQLEIKYYVSKHHNLHIKKIKPQEE